MELYDVGLFKLLFETGRGDHIETCANCNFFLVGKHSHLCYFFWSVLCQSRDYPGNLLG